MRSKTLKIQLKSLGQCLEHDDTSKNSIRGKIQPSQSHQQDSPKKRKNKQTKVSKKSDLTVRMMREGGEKRFTDGKGIPIKLVSQQTGGAGLLSQLTSDFTAEIQVEHVKAQMVSDGRTLRRCGVQYRRRYVEKG